MFLHIPCYISVIKQTDVMKTTQTPAFDSFQNKQHDYVQQVNAANISRRITVFVWFCTIKTIIKAYPRNKHILNRVRQLNQSLD